MLPYIAAPWILWVKNHLAVNHPFPTKSDARMPVFLRTCHLDHVFFAPLERKRTSQSGPHGAGLGQPYRKQLVHEIVFSQKRGT